jgi:type III pantothenate kinase
MLLAIDVGNTNTVFAAYKGKKLLHSWRCETASARSHDEYASFLSQLFTMAGLSMKDVSDVIVSSVVPEANFQLLRFCQGYINKDPLFVSKDNVPIKIDLDRPEDVGADRLVNAVAVLEHYQVPAIVIDFGTATTFDVVTAEGHYAGGVIAPGIQLSIEALNRAAAKLPKVRVRRPDRVIGKATVEAIQSGMYYGYQSLIEGLVRRISDELGVKPFVIATGGLAPLFSRDTPIIDTADEELTLKGLVKIYESQKQ